MKKNQLGQSLIEVILITVVVATVMTALAASISMSSKNTSESKRRSMATSFVQETLEIFHRERFALGWSTFQSSLSSGTYCFDALPVDSTSFTLLSLGECTEGETIADTIYTREATLTISPSEVRVESVVTWIDGSQEKKVESEQTFKNIE